MSENQILNILLTFNGYFNHQTIDSFAQEENIELKKIKQNYWRKKMASGEGVNIVREPGAETPLLPDSRDNNAQKGTNRGHIYSYFHKFQAADAFKTALIVIVVLSVLVGIAGALIYKDRLMLGLKDIGVMSQPAGFYTMLGGFSAFLIITALYAIHQIVNRRAIRQQQPGHV